MNCCAHCPVTPCPRCYTLFTHTLELFKSPTDGPGSSPWLACEGFQICMVLWAADGVSLSPGTPLYSVIPQLPPGFPQSLLLPLLPPHWLMVSSVQILSWKNKISKRLYFGYPIFFFSESLTGSHGSSFFLQPLLFEVIVCHLIWPSRRCCISHLGNYLLCSSSCLLVEKTTNFVNMKGLSVDLKQSSTLKGKNILLPSGLGSCSRFFPSSTHFLSWLYGPCAQN